MTQANPIEITFRGLPHSEDLEGKVQQHLEHLHSLYRKIHGCHVVIEPDERRHTTGNRYHVRLHVHVPGKELVVGKHPSKEGYDDPHLAVNDAFKAIERQLTDYVSQHRHHTKAHFDEHTQGRVARLFPDDDYGFLESFDGTQVYFHRNSVTNADFDDLTVGTEVRFVEEEGEKGPQASTVAVKSAS
jgi:cold shock CspA family protein